MSDNHHYDHKHEDCNCEHNHEHHEDCCCENEHTMKLLLDDGSEIECNVIDVFDLDDDRAYIALLPLDDEEVLIYRYVEHEDGSFELLNIETDEEFSEVESAFFEMLDDGEFDDDFDDDDDDFDDDDFDED